MGKLVRDLIEYNGIEPYIDDKCSIDKNDITTFKQSNIDFKFCIPDAKPNIEQIIKVWAKVKPVHHKIVKTPKGVSFDGQRITGYKLLYVSDIEFKIAYVADNCEQTVHTAHTVVPYCQYIVMPEDYNTIASVSPELYIEDIFTNQTDCRCTYNNITLMTVVRSC